MEKKKTNCGIYKITNLIPNEKTGLYKVYIGSSVNLKNRKYEHFSRLKNNKHGNNYLQKAINKYGVENFKWEVIKYLENKCSKEILLEEEQVELNLYRTEEGGIDYERCYNISPITKSPLGYKHTKEAKLSIKNALKGRKLSEEHRNNISIGNTGKKLSEETKKKIGEKSKLSARTKEWKEKISKASLGNTNGKKSRVINLDTNEIFNSLKEAAEFYNIKYQNICRVCNKRGDLAGGYRWKYLSSD